MVVDLWGDCEKIPYQFAVHLAQHNERAMGRNAYFSSDLQISLNRYQRQRRFSGNCDLSRPESFLWACSRGFVEKTDGKYGGALAWLTSYRATEGGVFLHDVETKASVLRPAGRVYSSFDCCNGNQVSPSSSVVSLPLPDHSIGLSPPVRSPVASDVSEVAPSCCTPVKGFPLARGLILV